MIEVKLNVEVEGTWLTPLRYYGKDDKGKSKYVFRCRCGVEKAIRRVNVITLRGESRTKSCGCKKAQFLRELKTKNKFDKGNVPWNKGIRWKKKNKEKISWNRGMLRITREDGSKEWVKVSDKVLGKHHKWCECGCRKNRRKFGNREWAIGEYELQNSPL